ncbi:MAG: 4Fe-4S binding protein [Chloroflexi bacterium]|nr:4Fe-4S binding protein [Chloroflexota bacterium]MBU1750559.1 4Fe-4S binding protein [Chloroflexota bacterium]MBU1878070.1 4Fe-4S binding protein [Chloroflexota bacterium]
MYPKISGALLRHWLTRSVFLLLGIVLLYAPFALLTRFILFLTGAPYTADVHRICLRMPIQWLAQPWMYGTMVEQPMYLVAILVLPLLALFVGPLFCGWMCPAGQIPEILSRFVPCRFQIDLAGKVNVAPVRYGFLVGLMATTFVGGNACCSLCNFTHTQNIISAGFGDFQGLSYWASFSIVSFGLWFVVLGLFTRGGRGWCNLLCPAGALMGLTHTIGSRLKIGRSIVVDPSRCRNCKTCVASCPAWAISDRAGDVAVNAHACNVCMDCVRTCPNKAITYSSTRSHGISPERAS